MDDESKKEVIDVGIDIFEAVSDQFLDAGLLRDIPVLGTVVGIARIGKSIPDRLFLLKVKKFLFALSDVSEEERQQFFEQIATNEKLRQKTGEVVLLLLERADDLEKPEIIARVFAAHLRAKINLDLFRRLSSAVDLAYVEDLKQLVALRGGMPLESKTGLLRTGLTEISRMESPRKTGMGDQQIIMRDINITNLGAKFIEIMEQYVRG